MNSKLLFPVVVTLLLVGCDTLKENQDQAVARCTNSGGVSVMWFNTTTGNYESICRNNKDTDNEQELAQPQENTW